MITLRINHITVTVPYGTTLLEAARSAGIPIPALCYLEGYPHYTSCLLCSVEDRQSGKLLPACSARAEEGMEVETENARVQSARRDTLELLLSEHGGDCLAPCERACPAHFDIPLMIRQIAAGMPEQALRTIQEAIPFPAVLGRICPAPCEKACRRKQYDAPVAICKLKQLAGDDCLDKPVPLLPPPGSKQFVAIVGAGPAGLSAAFYLLKLGYPCTVFDKQDKPGGKLYSTLPAGKLDPLILQNEIARYLLPHVRFELKVPVGREYSLAHLRRDYAAVILTPGNLTHSSASVFPVKLSNHGIAVTATGFATELPGVFAGGAAVTPIKMAVSAVAHGKALAQEVHSYLIGTESNSTGHHKSGRHILSVTDYFSKEEAAELAALAGKNNRINPARGSAFTLPEAREEAGRCLHCDCYKVSGCALRKYSLLYGAKSRHYTAETGPVITRTRFPGGILFEPGKCIKCGRCVRISAASGQGLTFLKRGYDTRVSTPFNSVFPAEWEHTALHCASACPTGALSITGTQEEVNAKT